MHARIKVAETHVDVLIVGAGLSGIGAACTLQTNCPGKSYVILEAREELGGTWDLFRFPGIRSDSDMYTLGYPFRPWTNPRMIADGQTILDYIRETAREYGIDREIRYGLRVEHASWSTLESRWTVVAREGAGGLARFTCGFLFMCAGYFRYDEGFTPDFEGVDRFEGRIVHPQKWSDDIDYADQRVVVIGSGATAVTMVPVMAKTAAHVTMLQRSPTYMISLPSWDSIANVLQKVLPSRLAYRINRWKNVLLTMLIYYCSRRWPERMKALLISRVRRALGKNFDVDTHFTPTYGPWDQRLCLVPDGDFFEALKAGRASIATDHIDTFTETGLRLRSGRELEADLVVTATGLQLQILGGIRVDVDGERIEASQTMAYKGMMVSGVPNLAWVMGYINASWTLKCDLVCEHVCRLLNYMDEKGCDYCVPRRDPSVEEAPMLDFSSGYIQRSIDVFPRQGSRAPWKVHQNYLRDLQSIRRTELEDGVLEFSRKSREPAEESVLPEDTGRV